MQENIPITFATDRARDCQISLRSWPGGHTFALFLSHDVDQIRDRELWRLLADLNHVRKVCLGREQGNAFEGVRRICRSLTRPKPALLDFNTILKAEGRHGFRSTFFLLHDRYWARYGSRYRISDPALARIVDTIAEAGCEIGVHGGYYSFDDARGYERSRQAIAETFGVEPVGIRNHHLRFSGAPTWKAHAEAGFAYDATFGYRDRFGPRDSRFVPFWAEDANGQMLDLIELPLTVMDTTVFRYLGLEGESAVAAVIEAIDTVVAQGGLVSLLWHNNYFNEPEYADWERTYVKVLDHLASLNPWCATGAEIAAWWRARSKVTIIADASDDVAQRLIVRSPERIEWLTLEVEADSPVTGATVGGCETPVEHGGSNATVTLPPIKAGSEVVVELTA